MGVIVTRSPRTRQPQSVSRLARTALSPSAAWAFSSPVDAASNRLATLSSAASMAPSPSGMALRVSGTAALDRVILRTAPNADNIGSGDFTVIIRLILRANLTNAYVATGMWMGGGALSASNWYIGAGNSFVSNTVDFGVACGGSAFGASATTSWTTDVEYTLVGRRAGTTLLVDKFSGISLVASGSVTNAYITTVNYNALNLGLGEFIGAGAAYNLDSDTSFLALFPRSLSDGEVRALVLNPWQLFAPIERRIWVPGAGGGGVPTLSAATYVPGSITSTGFRPRVTAS